MLLVLDYFVNNNIGNFLNHIKTHNKHSNTNTLTAIQSFKVFVKINTINYFSIINVRAIIFKTLLYRVKVCDFLHEPLFTVKYEIFHKWQKNFYIL